MNHIEQTVLDQPSSDFPMNLTTIVHNIAKILIIDMIKPIVVISFSGFVLNEVMPFIAKDNIFFRGYLLSPANLS